MGQSDDLSFRLTIRLGRVTEPFFAIRDIMHNAGLRGDGHAIADLQVACQSDLACQNDIISQFCAARNAGLRHNQTMLPNADVVRDLNQVVYLGSFPNYCWAERSTIDCHVGPNLNIFANNHVADPRAGDV